MYILRWYRDVNSKWVLNRSEKRKDLDIVVPKGQQVHVFKYMGDYLARLKVITG